MTTLIMNLKSFWVEEGIMKCSKCGKEISDISYCSDGFISSCCHAEIIQEEKIPQMTEEQADKLIVNVFLTFFDISEISSDLKNRIKQKMRKEGFIIKSELQTLVEEAEEMWKGYSDRTNKTEPRQIFCNLIEKQSETIQALKKDHPEFNK